MVPRPGITEFHAVVDGGGGRWAVAAVVVADELFAGPLTPCATTVSTSTYISQVPPASLSYRFLMTAPDRLTPSTASAMNVRSYKFRRAERCRELAGGGGILSGGGDGRHLHMPAEGGGAEEAGVVAPARPRLRALPLGPRCCEHGVAVSG